MTKLYVLYEHSAGYGVFKVQEFEEIGMLLPQLEAAVHDLGRFNSVVQLVGFLPFKSAVKALEGIHAISEGILPEDLQQYLDVTIPKTKKKDKITLGVSEPKLGAAITEALGIQCTYGGAIPEIIRGIGHHFHNLVKGLTKKNSIVAQLGLSHSYAGAKIKYNVHRVDNMIIQSIALVDQLDKNVNTFSMRLREWYSYHFPELVKIVPDNYTYARLTKFIKNRKDLSEDSLEGLEEITLDAAKAQDILNASKSSMGMDISEVDLNIIDLFAGRVIDSGNLRRNAAEYLRTKMRNVAPNLATLIGDQVGARLISHAGSLTNLAKYPASTVQILGAEKALFRALKTRGNTPKYGLLFHSTFIGRAGTKNKGRISRYLANKCSIASRIDCFTDQPTHIYGDKLRQQVEDRLKFYESGDVPKKNIEVMKEALEEVEKEAAQAQLEKKKKKKKKKRQSEGVGDQSVEVEANGEADAANGVEEGSDEPPKKKKKKRKSQGVGDESAEVEANGELDTTNEVGEGSAEPPKKKKKSKKNKDE